MALWKAPCGEDLASKFLVGHRLQPTHRRLLGVPSQMQDRCVKGVAGNGCGWGLFHCVLRGRLCPRRAVVDGASSAYRMSRPTSPARELFVFGVIGHGPNAKDVAERLVEQIRTWDREHRSARARIEAYPAGTPDQLLPAGRAHYGLALARNLRASMAARNVTAHALAAAMGVHPATVRKALKGETLPDLGTLARFAVALDVEVYSVDTFRAPHFASGARHEVTDGSDADR
ncbi:helix-turn-helix domain-containing protein [Embleya sp. NPDC050154]|uniref:helix-turn-helix domain-containing protein n=1 Tax=Embleya sp. NPDC050154 TaxID=3363988 RepID=UPI0037AE0F3C